MLSCYMLGTVTNAAFGPKLQATSQSTLLEPPGRRNAVGDVDETAKLRWLRLREMMPKLTNATSRESSPSVAADPASRSAMEQRPAAVDSTAVRPSTLGRLRRVGTGPARVDDATSAKTLVDGRRVLSCKPQTSLDSYVTAPSEDIHYTANDDDRFPFSSRRLANRRRGDAASLVADNANRRGVPVTFPHELPPVDLRLSTAMPPNSRGSPPPMSLGSAAGDFEFDPFEYELETGDSEDDIDTKKVTVPVSICLVIIAGYIFAGAVLFTLWEDWDYLTGSYFCFITLSTIGFGDIVPGTDMDKWNSHEKLVLCALWLAFGLSLLAMCFNLMQEEVKEKCKWIGKKLGLLKDEEDAR